METYLSISDTVTSPSGEVVPYLKVMRSGCLFLDVIFTMEAKVLRAVTWPSPDLVSDSRMTNRSVSVSRRWLQRKYHSNNGNLFNINNITHTVHTARGWTTIYKYINCFFFLFPFYLSLSLPSLSLILILTLA